MCVFTMWGHGAASCVVTGGRVDGQSTRQLPAVLTRSVWLLPQSDTAVPGLQSCRSVLQTRQLTLPVLPAAPKRARRRPLREPGTARQGTAPGPTRRATRRDSIPATPSHWAVRGLLRGRPMEDSDEISSLLHSQFR